MLMSSAPSFAPFAQLFIPQTNKKQNIFALFIILLLTGGVVMVYSLHVLHSIVHVVQIAIVHIMYGNMLYRYTIQPVAVHNMEDTI